MNRVADQYRRRLADASVVSLISAPRQENCAAVTVSWQSGRWIAGSADNAWSVAAGDFQGGWAKILVLSELWQIHQFYLSVRQQSSPADSPMQAAQVPARKFPFASHIDLLTSPIEGLLFDADDFLER